MRRSHMMWSDESLVMSGSINTTFFFFLSIYLSLIINHCLLFHIPINIRPEFSLAETPSLWLGPARLGSACVGALMCDSRHRKWREMTFDEMAWHYPIMVNGGGGRVAESFKCHFGNSGWPRSRIHFGPLWLHLSSGCCFLLFLVRPKSKAAEWVASNQYRWRELTVGAFQLWGAAHFISGAAIHIFQTFIFKNKKRDIL